MKVTTNWKSSFVRAAGFGAGFALLFLISIALWSYFSSLPKKPKPWNKDAIIATYDSVDTEGDKNTVVFYYTLQNNTDIDYKFPDIIKITVMSRLKKQKSLSGQKNDEFLKPDYPIFIPTKQRIRFAIHLGYPYDKTLMKDASKEEGEKYKKEIEVYFNNIYSNLNGFVLFDELNRYQIEFPKGW